MPLFSGGPRGERNCFCLFQFLRTACIHQLMVTFCLQISNHQLSLFHNPLLSFVCISLPLIPSLIVTWSPPRCRGLGRHLGAGHLLPTRRLHRKSPTFCSHQLSWVPKGIPSRTLVILPFWVCACCDYPKSFPKIYFLTTYSKNINPPRNLGFGKQTPRLLVILFCLIAFIWK